MDLGAGAPGVLTAGCDPGPRVLSPRVSSWLCVYMEPHVGPPGASGPPAPHLCLHRCAFPNHCPGTPWWEAGSHNPEWWGVLEGPGPPGPRRD